MRGLPALCCAFLAVACMGDSGNGERGRSAATGTLAFVEGFNGYIYTADVRGRLRRLTRGDDCCVRRVVWSPDGSRLAAVTNKVPESKSAGLLLMDAGGARQRLRAFLSSGEEGVGWISNDAIEIREPKWPGHTVVRVLDPDDSRTARTARIEGLRRAVVSPDGRRRAVVRRTERGDTVVFIARGDGTGAVNVSRARAVGDSRLRESPCSWSPDSRRLTFLLDRGWGDELFVVEADGSARRRLSPGYLHRGCPEWSPDGRLLAYVSDEDDDGRDELRVVPGAGGRSRKLVELEYIEDFDWRPTRDNVSRPTRIRRPRAPRAARLVRTASILRKGGARIVDVRLLRRFSSDSAGPFLADMSADGALVAVFERGELTALNLRTGSTQAIGFAGRPYEHDAAFSPDGRTLLYRRWDRLIAHDLATGRSTTIARAHWGSFAWLRDGRVVFSDGGRLKIVRPGERPRPMVGVPRVTAFAITPDGRRLLYDHRCETFLVDRATRARRRISGRMFTLPGSWAPDGSYFVLQSAEECDPEVGVTWAYHSGDTLYTASGALVTTLLGRGATWSRDSSLVFVYPHPTGSAVAGLEGLVAVDARRLRESTLIEYGNAYSPAFIGPGRWVVFTRYDRPHRVPYDDRAGGVYIGRIAGR